MQASEFLLRDFGVQGFAWYSRWGFLHRRLVWDVPGPGEEQESPSSRRDALRADLRDHSWWPAAAHREGPKSGYGPSLADLSPVRSHWLRAILI